MATLQEELENQKKSHEIQIRGFMQERDMYKARLSSQGQSKSVYGGLNGHVDAPAGDAEYESLLGDLQHNFDVYRNEIGIDLARLREELQDSQRDTAQLHASLAKANAKVEYHNGMTRNINFTLLSHSSVATFRAACHAQRILRSSTGRNDKSSTSE